MPTRPSAASLPAQLEAFALRPTPEAARALGESGADDAFAPLVAAAQDAMEGELAVALRAAVRTLATPDRLARWGSDPDVAKRRVAAHALSARYEAHAPLLAKALRDSDDEVRAVARRALASWVKSDALHALMRELLAHDGPRVRALAADALGPLGDAGDATKVTAALAKEADERARHALERAAARLGG